MKYCSEQRIWRRLVAVLVSTGGVLWPAPPVAAQAGGASEATYEVTFQGNWTTASTPDGVVGGAHFTTLIGAVHNDRVTFWRLGGLASPGVEAVAELGATGRFESEIGASLHAASVIKRGVGGGGTSRATFSIDVTRDHPLVTLLSMIGPSPDWFVGISGRSLLDGSGRWVPRLEVDLFPYDAGTEEGAEFSLDNPPTDPQGTITSIRGTGKFSNERMAGLTIVRREAPAPTVRLRASPNPVAEGGSVTVTATLSQALAGGVTIPLTLTAGTAEPGDYGSLAGIAIDGGSTTGTGAVTTTNDVDEDDETFTVALGSLPSSVAAGSPSSVEVTIRDEGPVAVPGLTFSPRRVTVTEGSTAAYEVALDAAPSPSVTVSVDSGDTGAATVSPASLDFTTSNWRTPQQVTVTGVQDADATDEAVTVTHGGTGVTTGTVTVLVDDDDTAPPERPGRPDATPRDGMLDVSWPAVPGAESYTVQWKSGLDEYSDARQQTVRTPSARLSGLTNGVAYTVRVRASSAGGDSGWSEEATGTPLQPVPALPAAGAGLLGLLLALLGARRRGPTMNRLLSRPGHPAPAATSTTAVVQRGCGTGSRCSRKLSM